MGDEHRSADADRDGVAQLLVRHGRAEGEHGGRAAVRLDKPDGLLDRALLVRARRVPEVLRVDRPPVGGERDAGTRRGNPLDAGEDAQRGGHVPDFMRASVGSNKGVEPATATRTG